MSFTLLDAWELIRNLESKFQGKDQNTSASVEKIVEADPLLIGNEFARVACRMIDLRNTTEVSQSQFAKMWEFCDADNESGSISTRIEVFNAIWHLSEIIQMANTNAGLNSALIDSVTAEIAISRMPIGALVFRLSRPLTIIATCKGVATGKFHHSVICAYDNEKEKVVMRDLEGVAQSELSTWLGKIHMHRNGVSLEILRALTTNSAAFSTPTEMKQNMSEMARNLWNKIPAIERSKDETVTMSHLIDCDPLGIGMSAMLGVCQSIDWGVDKYRASVTFDQWVDVVTFISAEFLENKNAVRQFFTCINLLMQKIRKVNLRTEFYSLFIPSDMVSILLRSEDRSKKSIVIRFSYETQISRKFAPLTLMCSAVENGYEVHTPMMFWESSLQFRDMRDESIDILFFDASLGTLMTLFASTWRWKCSSCGWEGNPGHMSSCQGPDCEAARYWECKKCPFLMNAAHSKECSRCGAGNFPSGIASNSGLSLSPSDLQISGKKQSVDAIKILNDEPSKNSNTISSLLSQIRAETKSELSSPLSRVETKPETKRGSAPSPSPLSWAETKSETLNPLSKVETKSETKFETKRDPTSPPSKAETKAETKGDSWVCEACTFINMRNRMNCSTLR